MTNIYKDFDVRMFRVGLAKSRPTKVIPQATAENLFTVTGGNILLTGLVGEITAAMDAVATTLKAGYTPSAAGTAATDLSIASADLTGQVVGVHLYLPAAKASAMATDLANLGGYQEVLPLWLLPPGALTLTGTGLNTGGRIKWDLYYIPLDDTSTVSVA